MKGTLKLAELRQLSVGELQERLEQKREEMYKQRMAWHSGSLENPNEMTRTRKDIARLLTLLREHELAAEVIKKEGK